LSPLFPILLQVAETTAHFLRVRDLFDPPSKPPAPFFFFGGCRLTALESLSIPSTSPGCSTRAIGSAWPRLLSKHLSHISNTSVFTPHLPIHFPLGFFFFQPPPLPAPPPIKFLLDSLSLTSAIYRAPPVGGVPRTPFLSSPSSLRFSPVRGPQHSLTQFLAFLFPIISFRIACTSFVPPP